MEVREPEQTSVIRDEQELEVFPSLHDPKCPLSRSDCSRQTQRESSEVRLFAVLYWVEDG